MRTDGDAPWGRYPRRAIAVSYGPEPLPVDAMMVHAIERLFGVVPGVMGMTCPSPMCAA
jgi:hypothetical protein